MDEDELRRIYELAPNMIDPPAYITWAIIQLRASRGPSRKWLEAMARQDDARAVGKQDQVEASWAAMRERWQGDSDR